VNFDIGDVLSRAWQISWKNKSLWVFNVVLMLVSFLFLPVMLIPMIADIAGDQRIDDGLVLLLLIGGGVLFLLLIYPFGALLNTALTKGVLHAEREDGKRTLMELVRESYPFFWRYLGTMALFAGGMMLVMLLFSILTMLLSVLTFGLGMLCILPFSLLQYPLMLVWYVCMEQALTAVVVDNMKVMDATKHSWQLFRNNIFSFVIVGLVFYFGVTMLSSIMVVPLIFPLFFVPFMFEAKELGRVILVGGGIFIALFLPFFLIFQGALMTLMKSGWIITYLRITRSTRTSQLVLQGAIA